MQYEEIVRQVITDMAMAEGQTQPPPLGLDDDLSQAGLNSLTFVDLIVRLEDALDISVPDDQLLFSEAGTIRKLCGILAAQSLSTKSTALEGGQAPLPTTPLQIP